MKKDINEEAEKLLSEIEKNKDKVPNYSEEERKELEQKIHKHRLKSDPEYRKFREEEKRLANEFEEKVDREREIDQTVIITVVLTLFAVGFIFMLFG